MYRVYTRERIGRVEGVVYRLIGVDPNAEQSWRRYASACLWFSAISMVFIYALMRLQAHLPLNPNGIPAVNQYVSFNTAASFTTNTNWQAYGGETTMSYLTQMLALTFQNFVSAAVGHGGPDRADPRARPRRRPAARELLGRPGPRRPLHPAAAGGRWWRSC